ncbi:hypothetical protein VPH35_108263 [Triticum aestivum]
MPMRLQGRLQPRRHRGRPLLLRAVLRRPRHPGDRRRPPRFPNPGQHVLSPSFPAHQNPGALPNSLPRATPCCPSLRRIPRADFVPGADPEELGAQLRRRYVQGLQVILHQQLQVLVERYRVGALVCGVAGTVWLRWVAASKVFDGMWARKVLAEAEAAQRLIKRSACGGQQEPQEVKKCERADEASPRKDRRRVEFIFLRSLRTMLPLHSTLSVCFLSCHIAREAILPTDIYRWAMEGKLPYVAAFTEVDKLLGSRPKHCPLNARQLFRPVRVIGAWQLEAAAGFIAQRIGLQLPSVNFYAIAQRYLDEFSLPVQKILPHACLPRL